MFLMSVEYIQPAVDCRLYVATVSSLQVQRPHHTNLRRVHHNEYSEQQNCIHFALQRTHEALRLITTPGGNQQLQQRTAQQ
jgi:hypothetical protein